MPQQVPVASQQHLSTLVPATKRLSPPFVAAVYDRRKWASNQRDAHRPPLQADGIINDGHTENMKVIGKSIAETPTEHFQHGDRLNENLERWNLYPHPRDRVFKFHAWEDLEKWRQNQNSPQLR